MPPTDRTLGERAFEAAVKGYRNFRGAEKLPSDTRIYMESVVDKRRDPITEKSFSPNELNIMRDVVARRYQAIKPKLKESIAERRRYAADDLKDALKSSDPKMRAEYLKSYKAQMLTINELTSFLSTNKLNSTVVNEGEYYGVKPNIQYEDYNNNFDINSDQSASLSEEGAIGQTLGRFTYAVDPQGNLNIKDTYDFGPGVNSLTGQPVPTERIGLGSLLNPKFAAVQYGRTHLPQGQGRPVNISINSFSPSKAKQPTQNWFSRATTALGF